VRWLLTVLLQLKLILLAIQRAVQSCLHFHDVCDILRGYEATQLGFKFNFGLWLISRRSDEMWVALINSWPKIALLA